MEEIAKNAQKAHPAFFPARVNESSCLADLGADVGKVLRLAVSSGCELDRMRLVRWDGIQDFVGQRRSEVGQNIAAILRDKVEEKLGDSGICVRYDDVSLLVVFENTSSSFVRDFESGLLEGIKTSLPGIAKNDCLISFWKLIAVRDDGFEFEPAGLAAPEHPDSAESEAVAAEGPPIREIPAPSPRVVLADPVYRYCPLWEVEDKQVFGYLCEPRWPVGGGELKPEELLQEMPGDPRHVKMVDMETLHKAVDQVESVVDRLGFMNVLIPVHFQTLAASESADQYLEDCSARIWRSTIMCI